MRFPLSSISLSLLVALSACSAVHEPAPTHAANPMANFARFVPGEWRMTLKDGRSFASTWLWGPGQHSIGLAGGVDVYYWHPGRKQVCSFGLDPFRRGVSEGTMQFDGETGDGVFDLYQINDHRHMGLRWVFDGPDKYHATLLEATGPEGLKPMNGWDFVRTGTSSPASHRGVEGAPESFERKKAFEPLLGHTFEAQGTWAGGESFHVQSTFEWVPDVDAIHARTVALTGGGEPGHLLDAYFFHHTGTDKLRCLALSEAGGVYEGDWTVLDGAGLRLDLRGYEGEHVVPLSVRLDFEPDGSLRQRISTPGATEPRLLLDVVHKQLEPK